MTEEKKTKVELTSGEPPRLLHTAEREFLAALLTQPDFAINSTHIDAAASLRRLLGIAKPMVPPPKTEPPKG